MRSQLLLLRLLCGLSLILVGGAVHAATLTVVSAGGSTYVVQGSGLSGVAAFDATITYDPAKLGSPQVTQGTLANGTLFVANPNYAAGKVRIAFVHVSGISGTGPIATITFTPLAGGGGIPPSVTASMYDAQGAPIAGTTALAGSGTSPQVGGTTGSGWVPSSPGDSGGAKAPADGSKVPLTGAGGWPGTITLGGETGKSAEPPRPSVPEPSPPPPPSTDVAPDPAPAPAEAAPPKQRERLVLPAPPAHVLERFRTYKGERSVTALKPLFTQRGGAWIVQDPAVARADGKTPLTVLIMLDRVGLEAPNFALRSLELKALKTVGEAGWAVEGVPVAGSIQASIAMLLDDAATDIPLVVVPPLPAAWADKKLTEGDVNRFLQDRGTEKAPVGDLNNDGRRDYRDDYIMVGNYLVGTLPPKGNAEPVATEPKAASPAPPSAAGPPTAKQKAGKKEPTEKQ